MSERGNPNGFYSQFSKLHDINSRHFKAEKIINLMKEIKDDLGSLDCLDVGCSSGLITSKIQPFFHRMVGLDYDLDGISVITEEQRLATVFIRGDAMRLPFPDQFFGAIICAQVYEHVPNDLILFDEIRRVLKSEGMIYFSGPNKLYPIEPHYFIPFLHWLPEKLANSCLRLLRKADIYDVRSRTFWGLRKILNDFMIYDMTIPFLRFSTINRNDIAGKLLRVLLGKPKPVIKFMIPLLPNFNWILIKPTNVHQAGGYHVMD